MLLLNELRRRINDDSDNYQALGAEIREYRLKQSKTLSSVADSSFSVSYLCKIEKNKVRASNKYLKEICDKFDISEEKVESLLSSRDILLEAVKCFYYNDLKGQNDILFKCEGLDNHRIILIRFICAITQFKIVECENYINKLWKLASSLVDLDLVIFTTFYGIYKYYRGDYIESMDYIKTALEFNINIDFVKPIQYAFLFLDAYRTYSRNIVNYYNKLEYMQLEYGSSLDLEQVHYYMCLYYLNVSQNRNFKKNILKLKDKNRIYSLNIIYKIILHKDFKADVDELDNLAKCFYLAYNKDSNILSIINNTSLFQFDKLLITYYYYKQTDQLKSIEYLEEVLLPYIINNGISYIGNRLLNELLMSPLKSTKYKHMCDIFLALHNISMEVDSL